jgi:hypothetical protein
MCHAPAHDHPSGDPEPSRDDIEMTREIRKAAELGIAIHDHLVIGRKGHARFRTLGLISPPLPQSFICSLICSTYTSCNRECRRVCHVNRRSF